MASIPYNLNIEVTSGDDKTTTLTIENADGSTDADYSNWVGIFTVRESKDSFSNENDVEYQLKSTDASPRVSITSAGSPLVTTVVIDHFAREAADNTSTPLEPVNYYYDFQLTSPAGVVQTWLKGLYKVKWHASVDVS